MVRKSNTLTFCLCNRHMYAHTRTHALSHVHTHTRTVKGEKKGRFLRDPGQENRLLLLGDLTGAECVSAACMFTAAVPFSVCSSAWIRCEPVELHHYHVNTYKHTQTHAHTQLLKISIYGFATQQPLLFGVCAIMWL